jgi:pyruvate/2-oxoglutarate dehydrogenase complex dihydrolipoamide dehydrogenase (E3) component
MGGALMEAVKRASRLSETRGFIRTLFEPDGNRILGFTGFDSSLTANPALKDAWY